MITQWTTKNDQLNKTLEQFPTPAEIKSAFENILRGKKFKERRLRSDANGVSVYEIEISLENGETIEYNYQKATYNYQDPSLPPSARFAASIHVTKFDSSGVPYAGECVANYLSGAWTYVSEKKLIPALA